MIYEGLGEAGDGLYDVCIIGSGPAGGAVANELAGSGLRICVLESGRRKTTPFSDALRVVESEGIAIKDYSRERVHGGASTTWAGLSGPFDPIDFEKRNWVAGSGWPVSREELLDYYARAAKNFRFPPLELFQLQRWEDLVRNGSIVPEWNRLEPKVFLACAEPQNFGREFTKIYSTRDVDLILDATVVRLEGDSETKVASSAVVRSSMGNEREVHARVFVLAANGIENCRLLLNSTFAGESGLGNENDQVGRWFMNHPKNNFGMIVLRRPIKEMPAYFGFLSESYAGYIGLRNSEEKQRAEQLLNSYVRFEPLFSWSDNPGVESLIFFTKQLKFVMRTFRRMKGKKVVALRDYAETGDDSSAQNDRKSAADLLGMGFAILRHLPSVATYLYFRFRDRVAPRIRAIRIRNFMEMEPRAENRIELSKKKDSLGVSIPRVVHSPSDLDKRTMAALHEELARGIEAGGWGAFKSALATNSVPWPIDADASHHMGGTRMGNDPATSVVNADCRLHTSPNVFVAGGSVFPTSGNANPTFTLVALAIRLADCLKSQFVNRRP